MHVSISVCAYRFLVASERLSSVVNKLQWESMFAKCLEYCPGKSPPHVSQHCVCPYNCECQLNAGSLNMGLPAKVPAALKQNTQINSFGQEFMLSHLMSCV